MALPEEPMIAVLDEAKARRLGGRTMLIPSVALIREAIGSIPLGRCKTMLELRRDAAQAAGADITCPYAARVAWLAVAAEDSAPWWRVTREGRPYGKLPGGEEEHRRRLAAEDVQI